MPKHAIDRCHPPLKLFGYVTKKYHHAVLINGMVMSFGRNIKVTLPWLKFMKERHVCTVVVLDEKRKTRRQPPNT